MSEKTKLADISNQLYQLQVYFCVLEGGNWILIEMLFNNTKGSESISQLTIN